jgi:hypothetical protein
MASFRKIPTEISFSIVSAEQSGTNINITTEMKSYYHTAAGFVEMSHSLDAGTTWTGSNTSSFQFENDMESIELSPKSRNVKIVWHAAHDLNATSSYSNVWTALKFKESGSATFTDLKSGSYSGSVDFTPTTTIPLIRPYPDEPDFEVEFKSLVNQYRIRTHFQVEADLVSTYDGANYQIHDTENSQVGWQVSGTAFPSNGVLTETSSLGTLNVTLLTGSLSSASNDLWYVRVSRSLFRI